MSHRAAARTVAVVADRLFVIDDNVEVRARHGYVALVCDLPGLGQRTPARERMADEVCRP
jgi:hypothetical protein